MNSMKMFGVINIVAGIILMASSVFLLVHLLTSSDSMPIGIAIAFEKPSIIFRESKTSLPFLLRQIEGATVPGMLVRQFEFKRAEEILDLIRKNGQRLFR